MTKKQKKQLIEDYIEEARSELNGGRLKRLEIDYTRLSEEDKTEFLLALLHESET